MISLLSFFFFLESRAVGYLDHICQCWMAITPRHSFSRFTFLHQHMQQHNTTITVSQFEQILFKYRVLDGFVSTRIQEDDGAFLPSIIGCHMKSSLPLHHTHNRHKKNTHTRFDTNNVYTVVLGIDLDPPPQQGPQHARVSKGCNMET